MFEPLERKFHNDALIGLGLGMILTLQRISLGIPIQEFDESQIIIWEGQVFLNYQAYLKFKK